MKNNAAIVQVAVEQNGWALEFASEEMQNNKAIVQAAVDQDWRARKYAGRDLW